MDLIKRFKSLPSKTRNLLSLSILLALLIALPLFIWALVNMNFNLREKAATGEPPVDNPIYWASQDVYIMADDFGIMSGGKHYYDDGSSIAVIPGTVDLTPGDIHWANMEVRSEQYGDNLRFKVYFKAEGSTWHIDSIGVLNSNYSDSWITYNGPFYYTALGYFMHIDGYNTFTLRDPNNGNVVAEIYYKNLRVMAFTNSTPPPTASYEPTPTATGNVQCNQLCQTNNECSNGLVCYIPTNQQSGTCRNPQCVENSNCSCASATATATSTATASSTSSSSVTGDVNNDGDVNIVDIGIVVDHYGENTNDYNKGDVNGDGVVNIVDLGIIIDNY